MMNEILMDLLYIVLSAAVTIGGAFAVKYINAKTNSQYKEEVTEAVATAVTYIQQVYVDRAKANQSFKESNQKVALHMAISSVYAALTPAALSYLRKNRNESEVNDYLTAMIEEAVRIQKKKEGL